MTAPIFIPSKSRADVATTPDALDELGLPYRLIVEEDQWRAYRRRFPPERLLVLHKAYQDDYDTFDDPDQPKSKGPGPARNQAWEIAIAEGADWHWVMDDNITMFTRYNKNRLHRVADGTMFDAMEAFCDRYRNVAMAGPNYFMFVPARGKMPPFRTGTRIFSCNLIRNDTPFRWRGRYNEDTDLSIRMLKGGWATVLFNAFQQLKVTTQTVKGGNTEAFYAREGTYLKSKMLTEMHPDVAKIVHRWGRVHHYVDYGQWRNQPLLRRPDAPPVNFRDRLAPPEEWAQQRHARR